MTESSPNVGARRRAWSLLLLALSCCLSLLAWVGPDWRSDALYAQDSTPAPMLFAITLESPPLLPAIPTTVQFHAQLADGVVTHYVASGTAADRDYFAAAGLNVRKLDATTDEKRYSIIANDAVSLIAQLTTSGTALLQTGSEALVALAATEEQQWLDGLAAQNKTARALFADSVALPEFPLMGETRARQAPAAIDACQNLLVNGDWEGSGGWLFGPTPARGSVVNSPVHTGARAVRLGVPDGHTNVFAHSTAYQRVTIPSTARTAVLTYWEKPGGGSDSIDYREILLLRTNYTVLRLLERVRPAGDNQWVERSFDVSDHRGQTFVIYLNVFNNGGGTRMVNYLDDIALTVCEGEDEPPTATATSAVTPTVPATATPTATATAIPTNTPTSTGAPTATATPTVTASPTLMNTPTPTPTATGLLVRMASVNARGQSEVTLPLELVHVAAERAVGVISADVFYDDARVTAVGCATSSTFDLILCNVNEAGKVQLSAISVSGVATDTVLADIRFAILDETQGPAALTVQVDTIQDTETDPIPVRVENGQIDFGCVPGDVNCDDELSARDALLILQFDIGSIEGSEEIPPPPNTLYTPACDVNRDNACGIVDALFVLQCIVGESNALCPTSPEARDDDVPTTATLYIDAIPAGASGPVTVPVVLNAPDGISAASIEVHYDPAQLRVNSCVAVTADIFDYGMCNGIYENDGVAPDVVRFNVVRSASVSGTVKLAEIAFEPLTPLDGEVAPHLVPVAVADIDSVPVTVIVGGEEVTQDFNVFMPSVLR